MLVLLVLVQAAAVPSAASRVTADSFDRYVTAAIHQGVFPGGALVVGRRDTILVARGYGRLTWWASSGAVDPDSTLYDLASVTKVIATTTSLMLLVDAGKVRLDDPVSAYIPEFHGPGTAAITVRQLLTHTSGLPATLPLFQEADSAAAMRMVHDATPLAPPGTRVTYSDVNAILLGEIVQRASGEPLDVFAERNVLRPLGLERTLFRPPARWRPFIAPTGQWHGHPVAGVVNDQSAVRLGGVAGHAGLFATAADVARFAQFMLRQGTLPDGSRLVRAETVRLFTTRATPASAGREARALGWQAIPTGEKTSSAGTLFGPNSFGHTGWTGTSVWIDPSRDVFVVLLTNRAFAPRTNRSFSHLKEVRGRLADEAVRLVGGAEAR